MPTDVEMLYAKLLNSDFQQELFGDLRGFGPKGEGYIACCPFHDDPLPTFMVYRDRPEYFCFVCSARGDWIRYLQLRDDLSFSDALEKLSTASGIPVRDQNTSHWRDGLERTLLLESVQNYFFTQLWSPPGLEVLHTVFRRGYAMEEVEGMGLGFYPGLDKTRDYLISMGFQKESLDALLSRLWKNGMDEYRLVIPYRDSAGRLMAFYAMDITRRGTHAYRPLTDVKPVADTPFLLYRARGQEEAIVVEGFFDALLLDQIALKPVIGTGKDGLTEEKLEAAISLGIRHFILCLGNGAREEVDTAQAIKRIRSRGLEASVMAVPKKYRDIDEFIRSTSLDRYKRLLTRIKPAPDSFSTEGS
ncbi:MAG: CHC2 zinc finger domain-containing protein [Desulfomonilia bacterium]